MHKDSFEQIIGAKLRGASAAVPSGAWDAIRKETNAPGQSGLSNQGISFVGMAITAVIMIGGMALYSPSSTTGRTSEFASITPSPATSEPTSSYALTSTEPEMKLGAKLDESQVTIEVDQVPSVSGQISNAALIATPAELTSISMTRVSSILVEKGMEPPALLKANSAGALAAAESPQARISASVVEGYAPLTIQLINTGKADVNVWDFGSGERIGASIDAEFDEPGTYRIYLIASNENGKSTQDEVTIVVREASSFDIPNSFSPNGDGLNESYGVRRALHIKDFLLVITDEQGTNIFQTKDLNQSWTFDPSRLAHPESRLFVNYRAVGADGVVHAKVMMPLTVIR